MYENARDSFFPHARCLLPGTSPYLSPLWSTSQLFGKLTGKAKKEKSAYDADSSASSFAVSMSPSNQPSSPGPNPLSPNKREVEVEMEEIWQSNPLSAEPLGVSPPPVR